jgi:hypothetical protein
MHSAGSKAPPGSTNAIASIGYGSGTIHQAFRHGDIANGSAASRFYPCFTYMAKPATSERDAGLDAFLWRRAPRHPFGFERISQATFDALPPAERDVGASILALKVRRDLTATDAGSKYVWFSSRSEARPDGPSPGALTHVPLVSLRATGRFSTTRSWRGCGGRDEHGCDEGGGTARHGGAWHADYGLAMGSEAEEGLRVQERQRLRIRRARACRSSVG